VVAQLRHDPRTIALVFAMPCVLLTLMRLLFDSQPIVFQRSGSR
jgi:ABC-2 type transport system permease protein